MALPGMLQIEAAESLPGQIVRESRLDFFPPTEAEALTDMYGNRFRRLMFGQGDSSIVYTARVDALPPQARATGECGVDLMTLPVDMYQFLLPSRYCQSDRFARLAREQFGTARRLPVDQANDICAWIYEHVEYLSGSSNGSTSAADTMIDRAGVCRDFAHLGIALCRALDIPARYVSGYCLDLDPPDFHAYFQAFIGGTWVTFDPTKPALYPAYAPISFGRDAADCAWCTIYGTVGPTTVDVCVSTAQ
jgi:transglutaminase-like putative cysteine protease